jgi:O-antigen/teichoic acid export membrane protein
LSLASSEPLLYGPAINISCRVGGTNIVKAPVPIDTPAGYSGRARNFFVSKLVLFSAAGWVTAAYIIQQVLRLGTSITLAWLLAPELLGTMLLINTLRTGGELLTDVGVGQSIVNNPRGNDPDFYNTAWTIQIIRGVVLFAIALALTIPMSHIYENASLMTLLPVVAPIFIMTGLTSPSRFLLQKRMEVRKLTMFDLALAIIGAAIQIALAAYSPTIWALIWGLLISTALSTLGSFFLIDWRSHRLRWDASAAKEIFRFGKWVFAASLIYFLAMNFDRLYFADAIPIALLGVFGIARTFSETVMLLFQRVGNLLIFPKISASNQRGGDLRKSITPVRMIALFLTATSLAMGIALADEFIYLVYDQRYHAAGFFLTVLLFGTWFSILAAMADAMMMGIGKPSGVAFSNGFKLIVLVVTLPLVLAQFGINAALAVFVVAEAVRYAVLMWQKRRAGIGFTRQDIAATFLFIVMIFVFRELTMLVGLTGGINDWIIQANIFNG